MYSKEGTAAHELLDSCLQNECFDASLGIALYGLRPVYDTPEENAKQAEDAVMGVQVALDEVLDILESYDDAVLYVERSFKLPSIDPENTWGTCDICIHVPSLGLLYVFDYKHGAGKIVEIIKRDVHGNIYYENGQVLYYATGALYSGLAADVVILRVIQPRAIHADGPVRELIVPPQRLVDFLGTVNNTISIAQEPDAPLNPGEEQCQWCPANLSCPAREARALQVVASNFASFKDVGQVALPRVADIPMDRLVHIHKSRDILIDFLDSVQDYLYNFAMGGGHVFDHKLVEAQARRHWYGKDEEVAQALMELAGTTDWDKVYPRQLIGITAAETLIKNAFKAAAPKGQKKQAAEMATQAMAALTLKESSGNLVLVPSTDKRMPVNRAATSFANVKLPSA